MKIIDRAKNIFKLSQGEYIAPEKLENIFVQSPHIMQVWVHGDSLQNYLLAFVVPDPDVCGKDYNEEELKEKIYKEIVGLAKQKKLNSLEIPKQIQLIKEPFGIENGFLTPTLKLKRNVAAQKFKEMVDLLYKMPILKVEK